MSDQTPRRQRPRAGGEGDLPTALAELEQTLLADGEGWRRAEPSTARLAAHVRSLAGTALTEPVRTTRERRASALSGAVVTPASRGISPSRSSRAASRWISFAAACLIVALGASLFAFFGTHRPSGSTLRHASATAAPATPTAISTPTVASFAHQIAPLPAQTHLSLPTGGYLSAISFSSAQDGWVGGGVRVEDVPGANWSDARAFLAHYHQGAWITYPQTFAQASIEYISMFSANEGWAIAQHNFDPATNTQGATFLLHYTGGQWHENDDPAFANFFADSLVMRTPTFGYATGAIHLQTDATPEHEVIALLENGSWRMLQTPFGNGDVQIVMFAPDDGYALGVANGVNGFYHYSHGTWDSMPAPSGAPTSFTMPAPNNAWAAGISCVNTGTPNSVQPCTFSATHWDGASWKPLPPIRVSSGRYQDNRLLYSFATVAGQYWLGLADENDAIPSSQRQYTTLLYSYVSGAWQPVSLPVAHAMLATSGSALATSSWDGNGGTWTVAMSENPNVNYVLYTQGGAWQVYGQG